MVKYYKLEYGTIEISSDCEGGLKRVLLFSDQSPIHLVYGSNVDLVNVINILMNNTIMFID